MTTCTPNTCDLRAIPHAQLRECIRDGIYKHLWTFLTAFPPPECVWFAANEAAGEPEVDAVIDRMYCEPGAEGRATWCVTYRRRTFK